MISSRTRFPSRMRDILFNNSVRRRVRGSGGKTFDAETQRHGETREEQQRTPERFQLLLTSLFSRDSQRLGASASREAPRESQRRAWQKRPGAVLYHRVFFMQALLEALRPGEKDWALARAIDPARLPAHIAIIMDGNGRGAGLRRLPRVAGHRAGIGPVRSTVETCARLGVKALTLYAFSIENWKRPRAEVETLWRLLRYYLKQELPEIQKNDIRLQAIGRLDALPAQVRRELDAAVDDTSANRGLLVNLAINYSGRAEIVDAVNSILEMARLDGSIQTLKIDEELIDLQG